VVDIDEDAYRRGQLRSHLFGWLMVPQARLLQGRKAGSPPSDESAQQDIGYAVVAKMRAAPNALWLLGPGTTTRAVRRVLGFEGTLLGVDAVKNQRLLESDLNEARILQLLDSHPIVRVVVTPIGGQGYVFGRGNQQLSPEVLRRVGGVNILIVATPKKIQLLMGKPLLLDTGDPDLDQELSGYHRVCSGYKEEILYQGHSPWTR
jgi:predicted polyphosphate/ATP-dependent NAD kinase